MARTVIALCAFAGMVFAETAAPIFQLDAANYSELTGTILETQGDIGLSADGESVDFGTDGRARIRNFQFPSESFSVEIRYNLRSYGISESHYRVDLINNMTWTDTYNEGFSIQVGGGHYYPILPAEAYNYQSYFDFSQAVPGERRAFISQGVTGITMGTGEQIYKEIFSDRLARIGEWTHLIIVWDGEELREFINGNDATDGWRVNAADKPGNLPSGTKDLYFGCRGFVSYDKRHFDGMVGFIRIYDTVLSLLDARALFDQTRTTQESCRRKVSVECPKMGEYVSNKTKFKLSVGIEGVCSEDPDAESPDIAIQLCDNPAFNNDVQECIVRGVLEFDLDHLLGISELSIPENAFWRFGVVPDAIGKKAVGAEFDWSEPIAVFAAPDITGGYRVVDFSRTDRNVSQSGGFPRYDIAGRVIGSNHLRSMIVLTKMGNSRVRLNPVIK